MLNIKEDTKLEIEGLVKDLNKYSYEYYTKDSPSISDVEYDSLYNKLEELEKETNYILPDSPTQRIGDKILSGFNKITHRKKLWSLAKCFSFEDILEWDKLNRNFIKNFNKKVSNENEKLPPIQYILMKKFDGLTLLSQFNNGDLRNSSTRGQDGIIGEDVTEQSKTFLNMPSYIKFNGEINVHGEALMTKKAFLKYNTEAEKNGRQLLKNLRNGAAGAVRNLDVGECRKRKLIIKFYDITYSGPNKIFQKMSEKLDFIKYLGLPCADYVHCYSIEDLKNGINDIEDTRSSLPFDIDGAVIRIDDLRTCEAMGYTIKVPKFAMAYKFNPEVATTKLLNVVWQIGRTGRVTPKAVLEPVNIGGSTVSYATLNNEDFIKNLNLKIGQKVKIKKAGDVIPEVVCVENDDFPGKPIEAPTECPSCGGKLIKDGAYYICENTLGCKPQLIRSITHFCEKQAMNIEGLSEKTAELLIDNKIINSFTDIYTLRNKKFAIVLLPKFGDKKFQNLIESIEKSKKCSLEKFIFALGIPEVGLKTSKDLADFFKNITNIRNASMENLIAVGDIGDIVSKSIFTWFRDEENLKVLDELLSIISIQNPNDSNINKSFNPFNGKKVVLTGSLKHFTRSKMTEKLESLGAGVSGNVSKKTDFLLVGDNPGSKYEKALELGIKIITEEEFSNMLNKEYQNSLSDKIQSDISDIKNEQISLF